MLKGVSLSVFLACSLFMTAILWAGNKEMVEKEVQELDDLNKEALKDVPDVPKDGRIEIKADVTYEKGSPVFNIYEKNILSEKAETINFDRNQNNSMKEMN